MRLRSIVKAILPHFVLNGVGRIKRQIEARRNASQSPEQVFSRIYRTRQWGSGGPGAHSSGFHSGNGSTDEAIVGPYVDRIRKELTSCGPAKPKVVDLGCGDFSVGSRILDCCSEYIGVDVVPDLIEHLRATVNDSRASFISLDITQAVEYPDADVCFLRQVLQHLSNAQIQFILPRLDKYDCVYITEHYPSDRVAVIPNLDKAHGADIRLYQNSGVYLDGPPFSISAERLKLILEVPAPDFGKLYAGGFIRTYRLDRA